jgi:hypothetical protein
MTDLTPNDLSRLSDEEFNALCPQGYHAPGPASALSPAAQAVLNALLEAKFGKEAVELGFPVLSVIMGRKLAAALRAAADQVEHHWDGTECVDYLCAIAAELDGTNTTNQED